VNLITKRDCRKATLEPHWNVSDGSQKANGKTKRDAQNIPSRAMKKAQTSLMPGGKQFFSEGKGGKKKKNKGGKENWPRKGHTSRPAGGKPKKHNCCKGES